MYARHDLAWLTAAGWRQVQAATPAGTPAHATVKRWADAGWPLLVRRREPDPSAAPEDIFLGLAAPPDPASGARLRLPLRAPAQHIERTCAPLSLEDAEPALPARWRPAFAELRRSSAALRLQVYGSLALQALTGQAYLRDSSDIDLLFRPRSTAELDAGVRLLASHLATLPLDGEIVFPDGQAVAWKEWFSSHGQSGRVLVKSSSGVSLRAMAELRAGLATP